jgi:hypothetical protein
VEVRRCWHGGCRQRRVRRGLAHRSGARVATAPVCAGGRLPPPESFHSLQVTSLSCAVECHLSFLQQDHQHGPVLRAHAQDAAPTCRSVRLRSGILFSWLATSPTLIASTFLQSRCGKRTRRGARKPCCTSTVGTSGPWSSTTRIGSRRPPTCSERILTSSSAVLTAGRTPRSRGMTTQRYLPVRAASLDATPYSLASWLTMRSSHGTSRGRADHRDRPVPVRPHPVSRGSFCASHAVTRS